MLLHFIFCDMLGGFDVDKVLSHLFKLCSFHKKLNNKNKHLPKKKKKSLEVDFDLKIWSCIITRQTLYLSPSPLEWRKYLLISWVRTDTGLLTFRWKQCDNQSFSPTQKHRFN